MHTGIWKVSPVLIATLVAVNAAWAQDGAIADDPGQALAQEPITQANAVQGRLAKLKGAIKTVATPLPDGQVKTLGALVMQVKGRCQWRPDEKAAWKSAAINDSLRPGALIRTGLNSMLTLRCGLNSTVLVDSNTRVQLPSLVQEGGTLRTIVTVNRGRADIQVDRVGLVNDFSVLTPSGSLAVKGTGMGVQYDGFAGTSVVGARHNQMNAIEMRYFAREGYAWLMSGGATSTQSVPNPATVAALETQPEASLQAYEAEDAGSFDSAADQAMATTDSASTTTRVVLAQEEQLQASTALATIEEEVLLALLLEQQEALLAALQEAEEAAEDDIIDEVIEEVIDEIIDDDGDDNTPPTDILALDGYQAYFSSMNSPTDQSFLAAAMVLDLVSTTQPLGEHANIPQQILFINGGGEDRRQIPHVLEPDLFATFGQPSGARQTIDAGFQELPTAGPLLAMYTNLINYGVANDHWFSAAGPAPTQGDLEHMVQIYEDYLQSNPAVFSSHEAFAREMFTNSLNSTLYQVDVAPHFTDYGNALLGTYVPDFDDGGGFFIKVD